jgi:ABC-type antimicrobial peptide transport system permease subunit
MLLLGSLAALSLLLAGVGLFGVLAESVTQRRAEFGVRMTLGATARDITGMVMRQGLRLVAFGLALGVAASLVAGRYARSLLYEVEPADTTAYAFGCALLIAVAALACWAPALRAASVDPTVSLRGDS